MATANMVTETTTPGHLGDPSYLSHLSSSLNQLRQQACLCDVTVIVDNQRFPAHKAILSCASEYFQSMFTSGFQESTSNEVTVPGTGESFSQLLEFAYTGYFTLSPTTVAGVLNMACYMHFSQAVEVCANYLREVKDSITIDDCFEIWSVACNHGSLSELAESFRRHLVHSFNKCAESQSFLEHASVDFLLECLGDEEIETDTTTEKQILQAVIAWLQFNWETRNTNAANLLQKVRLGLIPLDDLQELVDLEIGRIEECKEVVLEVIELKTTGEISAAEPLSHRYPKWFATRNTISAFLNVGGKPHGSSYFDNSGCAGGSWKKLDNMASIPYPTHGSLSDFSLAVVNRTLYAAGGKSKYTDVYLNNFCKYDVDVNTWIELPDMLTKRETFVMIGHEKEIFVIGGMCDRDPVVAVERYSIVDNCWQKCAPLLFKIMCASAVSYRGRIIVVSYLVRDATMDTVQLVLQVYDPSKDMWHCVLKERLEDGAKPYPQLLTVQGDTLFYVRFKSLLADGKYIQKPEVQKVELNFDLNPPGIVLCTLDDDQCAVRPASLKAFSINGQLFVSEYKYVQQVNVMKGDDGVYDLSRWENIGDASQGSVVPFTFNKRSVIK
ncbi:kelch-like protein 6 isoform X2 [Amphiura filiformis]|uniref:kelch-like protein 6 isoform X2 n=1 Tax=Amphiura filiformis TaxID=82378 RepID=UPI003B22268A